jgi:hypothetical protein
MEAGTTVVVTDINSPFCGWRGEIQHELAVRPFSTQVMRAEKYFVVKARHPHTLGPDLMLTFNSNQIRAWGK